MTKNEIISHYYDNERINKVITHLSKSYNYIIKYADLDGDIKNDTFLFFLENVSEEKMNELHNAGAFVSYYCTSLLHVVKIEKKHGKYSYKTDFFKKYLNTLYSSKDSIGDYLTDLPNVSTIDEDLHRNNLIKEVTEEVYKLNWHDRDVLLMQVKKGNCVKVAREFKCHHIKISESLKASRKQIIHNLYQRGVIDNIPEYKIKTGPKKKLVA